MIKDIHPGMFLTKNGTFTFSESLHKTISGIVILVTDEYVIVDTGKEIKGTAEYCRQQLAGGYNLSTAELDKMSFRICKINEACKFLAWPSWDSWYWGDALTQETGADGKPAEAVDMCFGGHGWPHQDKIIKEAKVRVVKKVRI